VPYLSVGKLVFGFLLGYTKEEGIDSGARFFLLEWAQSIQALGNLPVVAYLLFCAAVLGCISIWAWNRIGHESDQPRLQPVGATPTFLRAAMLLGFAMMLLFSPHYPWYVVWLVPLFTLAPSLSLLTYLMAFFYLFTTALADPGPKMFLLNKILYSTTAVAYLLHLALERWPILPNSVRLPPLELSSLSDITKQLD
jgi:alpha-1,6-mannosyltransferase